MTYVGILLKKEKVFWKRMKTLMTKEFKSWARIIGFIVMLVLIITHYAIAGWHSLYELVLFIFNRKAFKINLARLQLNMEVTPETALNE